MLPPSTQAPFVVNLVYLNSICHCHIVSSTFKQVSPYDKPMKEYNSGNQN